MSTEDAFYCAKCLKRVDESIGLDDFECPFCDAPILTADDSLTQEQYENRCLSETAEWDAAKADGLIT